MAKKKEEVVEETTKQENPVKEEPKVDGKVEKIKVKKKTTMKKLNQDDEVFKVDLSKPPKTKEDAVQEPETKKVDVGEQTGDGEKVGEGGKEPEQKDTAKNEEPVQDEETPVLEEITENEVEEQVEQIEEEVVEAIAEAQETGEPLPENIQNLINFMNETGGDINDYVILNQDYSQFDEGSLLREYYRQTKPHLNTDEVNFLLEDSFSYDSEVDDEIEIKRKQLALKEQVADARQHLDGLKSQYYEDIKAGSKLTPDQQNAIDFFNRYNKEEEESNKMAEQYKSAFLNKTDQVFNDKFKGFEYNIGDKKFRFNVKDGDKVKDTQLDINNFVGKFLDENYKMSDAKGYHKSLYTAMNADAVANHFYEQGKADAMKDSVAKSKNIDMDPRQSHGDIEAGGVKVRVLGDTTSDFKFKIKQK